MSAEVDPRGSLVVRLSVHAHAVFGSAIITVSLDGQGGLSRYPLYRVDNACEEEVVVKQAGVVCGPSRPPLRVAPSTSALLGWDEPALPALQVQVSGDLTRKTAGSVQST